MTLAATIKRSEIEREAWKYTSLKTLKDISFNNVSSNAEHASPLPPAGRVREEGVSLGTDPHERHRLTFINGVWQPNQSQLHDLPLDILQGDAVHGYTLTLAGQTCLVTSPIELLFITLPVNKPTEANTTLNIVLGDNGRLTIIERHETPLLLASSLQPLASIMETTITLGEQAKLVHGKILHGNAATVHLAQTKVHAAKGAYYDHFTLLRGGKLVRDEIDVMLADTMAQCNLHGLMLLRDADHADTTTRITHAAPHGTSRQIYKSVVADKAHAVFQGKVIVTEGAQKTDAHQLSRALLLSDKAEINAKPELEIYADDVKCSHGSTIGDLDEHALFYLRARGIPESEARALLINAFVTELVDDIQSPELRHAVSENVEEWLRFRA